MNKKNYYILGIKYFNEHIDMNTNEMVEISDKINGVLEKYFKIIEHIINNYNTTKRNFCQLQNNQEEIDRCHQINRQ